MSDPLLPPIVQPPLDKARMPGHPPALPGTPVEQPVDEEQGGITGSRPLIFALLFGVTGVLGLPILWYSPAFSVKEKWLWSIINTLYTLGLLAIAIASLKVIFDAMAELR